MTLEQKASKSHIFDPNKDLPKWTRWFNNGLDFGGVALVYGTTITYMTIKTIESIPETTNHLYNKITDIYQTISPFIEIILSS
ncbi:hypothetical protein J4429_00465 [Candidatus Pacearchaeota archaeon]|nr:hypothetical protein [uncultured archaeon]AQS32563.1 hypothetical protein [uncultured archaeon]AQS33067.1 hypothetical protein [uncultured archaeon]MBS3074910.1 hypothetical protein [Candidatus Pacearchaeota archaeon]